MSKILFFEGARCVPRGSVENCRIRTAFINDKGSKFYLELIGVEVTKNSPEAFKPFTNAGFVDHCHYIKYGKDDENDSRHRIERNVHFEYTKKGILKLVNEQLGCSFDKIIITDLFDWYFVHKQGGGYNFMEDFEYNPEKAQKARNAYAKIDKEIREKLQEKYSKISLHSIGDDSITVRCYASSESMRKHGLDPDQRFITVPF